MSLSVKDISVSIDGTLSNKFKIEIDGSRFTMSNFVLQQRMLDHSHLSFQLTKDPEEDISETQFKVCSDIIGKPITLTLQTDMMEAEIQNFSGENAGDIEFDGFITGASATRRRSEYSIRVTAVSWDGTLDNAPDCMSYEEQYLKDIVETVITEGSKVENEVDPDFVSEPYQYCVKWNETSFNFLRRLAIRHGEWMWHDGKTLHFGKLPQVEAVELVYPSHDVPSYGIDLHVQHLNHSHVSENYQEDKSFLEKAQEKMSDSLNDLNEAAYQMSTENYNRMTFEHLPTGGFQWELDGSGYIMDLQDRPQAMGTKAGLLTYQGSSYCSKLAIAGRLIIKDNYITDQQSGQKSEVQQDEILITSITHIFDNDDTYQNTFSGVSGNTKYPPYANAAAVPRAMPTRAWVYDNKDPDRLGRVRVTFGWSQEGQDSGEREYVFTPWIRVAQPYSGNDKGFYFIPEENEEVMVDFEDGNAELPFVRASLYNGNQYTDQNTWAKQEAVDKNEVKAIRTRNGHTIEIHDKGKGGYIKIYDHKKNNYVITLSTDGKLIKLQSSGNIELSADNDIKMTAGNDIIMNAGHDMNAMVNNQLYVQVSGGSAAPPDSPGGGEQKATPVKGGEPSFFFSVVSGVMELGTDNEMLQVREKGSLQYGEKIEGIEGKYAIGTELGGLTISPDNNTVGLWSSNHIAIEADNGLGVYSKNFVITGSGNSVITTDGTLDIGGSTLHLN